MKTDLVACAMGASGCLRLRVLRLADRGIRDLARVGRALGALPRLETALVAGELSWSQVRLLARYRSGDVAVA